MSSRLVYRGGLSLPDSHVILDGIAFSALLSAPSTLLQNPLALALESLRGIPLRFIALIRLGDVYYDSKATPQIVMDIHPQALLSQVYFNNIFCLDPDRRSHREYTSRWATPTRRTLSSYASKLGKDEIRLMAARITPPPSLLPRPDDPTPRRPPPILSAKGRDLFPPLPMAPPPKPPKAQPQFKVPLDPAPTMERKNKDIVKAIVARNIPTSTLPKTHPEYKDTFQWIYRGVCFALRGDIKTKPVDEENASRLAKVHIGMYVK
ncbi:hypothetical protein BDZ89DRAFT_1056808 [Hymenopellis radicata]|nr:hypothetical protein BDZ89DRAFT_1056808 [Hymenopellis radicata]